MRADWKEERVLDAGKVEECSRLIGHRLKKSGDQKWRVWSEGCAGKDGRRLSKESKRVCRGRVS